MPRYKETRPTSDHAILTFDIASRTGWACRDEYGKLTFGSHRFAPPRAEPNVLFPAASAWFGQKINEVIPSHIGCETWGHLQGKATQILWGLNGILMSHAQDTVVLPFASRKWKLLALGCATIAVGDLAAAVNDVLRIPVTDCDEAAAVGILYATEIVLREKGML